jgi:hypothetical protein
LIFVCDAVAIFLVFGFSLRWHPRFAFVFHASPLCGATPAPRRRHADASAKKTQPKCQRSKKTNHRLTSPDKTKNR